MTHPALTDKRQEQRIVERRERIAHLLIQGHPETEIAGIVGVSRETVVRDVRHIKMEARGWYSRLATLEYVYEYKLLGDKLKSYEFELHQMKKYAKGIGDRIRITSALQDNILLQYKVLTNPTVNHVMTIINSMEKERRHRT